MKNPLTLVIGMALLILTVVVSTVMNRRRKSGLAGTIARLNVVKTLPRYQKLVARQRLLRIVSWVALGVSSLCLLVVASRPTKSQITADQPIGLDVMVVLDTSGSMSDYFTSVGASIHSMVDQFKTDRLGMIVFSGEAQLVLPLTDDYEEMKVVADYMQHNSPLDFRYHYAYGAAGGTDISTGLFLASARMANLPKERTKVVLLISDGEQTSSTKRDPGGNQTPNSQIVSSGASALAKQGIRMYIIAVKGEGGASGSFPSGRALLEDLAQRTSGAVYDAADPATVKQVFGQINKLLRSELEGSPGSISYEAPWTWLIVAFLGLLVYVLASSQRPDGGVL